MSPYLGSCDVADLAKRGEKPTQSTMRNLLTFCALFIAGCPPSAQAPSPAIQGEIRYIDMTTRSAVSEAALRLRLQAATHVLLGELHDNPKHHRAQAQLLTWSLSDSSKRAVLFEMLEPAQESAAQGYLAHGGSAHGFGDAALWQKGWPPFTKYEPILDVVVANRLSVYAANLPKADAKSIAMGSKDVTLPPFDQSQEESLTREIDEGHCGMLPKDHSAPMAKAQRARDLAMAEAMLRAGTPTVLIAGRGHIRKDRGVPFVLRSLGAVNANSLAIGLFEEGAPLDLEALALEYDIIGITPAPSEAREDPCLAFRK
jgi:uncharacterized iron-regulated protein